MPDYDYDPELLEGQEQDRQDRKRVLMARLAELKDSGDPEDAHYEADLALLAFIDDPEVFDAWVAVPKWYA